MNFTHALVLQLDTIPKGFFPIGDEATLKAFAEQAGNERGTAVIYELKKLPESLVNGINSDLITRRIGEVVSGDVSVELSTGGIANRAKSLLGEGKSAAAQFGQLAKKALKDRRLPNMIEAAPAVMAASKAANSALQNFDDAVKNGKELLLYTDTEDYIHNEHGHFVSEKWLDTPGNARRYGSLKLGSHLDQNTTAPTLSAK